MGEHGGFGVACAKSVPRLLVRCRVSPKGNRASDPAGRRQRAAAYGFSADAARRWKTCDNCEMRFRLNRRGQPADRGEDWVKLRLCAEVAREVWDRV
jgi:hypothetical protein